MLVLRIAKVQPIHGNEDRLREVRDPDHGDRFPLRAAVGKIDALAFDFVA